MSAVRPALVYNPRAGRVLRSRARFEKAVGVLRVAWPDIRLIETTGPRTAGPLAKNAVDEGADLIIVCGGDGTINEVSQSLSGTGVPVGIIPGGTANSLAHEIRLGNDMVSAARLMADSEPQDVVIGTLRQGEDETRFLLMAGIGFDALLVHGLDLDRKERWGKIAYWWIALKAFGSRLQPFDLVVDERRLRAGFALVSRARNYGGDLSIARGASLLANEFEVVVFESLSTIRLAWLFLTGVLTRTLHRKRDVKIMKAKRIEAFAVSDAIHVQVDGEAAGVLPATIELAAEPIRLMLPSRWLRRERARRS